ncbi:MAG: N-acetylmuramoyl-L-alanine amidase [Luteibacter sp.]
MIDILYAPLPYEGLLPRRAADTVDLVVIHCTELPDLAMAREYGERVLYEDRGTGASGHYYIDRDGSVLCYVDPSRVANHTRGYNPRSIGIELVNLGRYPDWFHSARQVMTEPYPPEQIAALRALLDDLTARFPSLRHIAGHEDLDTALVPASDDPENEVPRKRDPGPQFPWARAYDASRLGRLEG